LSLAGLIDDPFELLLELERRAKAGMARQQGAEMVDDAWTGIAFRLGSETFVAPRADVREVLPVPEQLTRVPGAKPWLKGIANVRGQLLTVVDLLAFLGGGRTQFDRHTRVLHMAARELPSAVIVNEVLGFRRFPPVAYEAAAPDTELRCERYLAGRYQSGSEVWPVFSVAKLVEDEQFQHAGEKAA
jgi:twitching motility protein PilI